MLDNRYRNITVKIQNGSGCIIQPDSDDFTYIFTAKHNVINKNIADIKVELYLLDNSGKKSKIEIKNIRKIYNHYENEKDASIIVFDKLNSFEIPLIFNEIKNDNNYILCGFPNTR